MKFLYKIIINVLLFSIYYLISLWKATNFFNTILFLFSSLIYYCLKFLLIIKNIYIVLKKMLLIQNYIVIY